MTRCLCRYAAARWAAGATKQAAAAGDGHGQAWAQSRQKGGQAAEAGPVTGAGQDAPRTHLPCARRVYLRSPSPNIILPDMQQAAEICVNTACYIHPLFRSNCHTISMDHVTSAGPCAAVQQSQDRPPSQPRPQESPQGQRQQQQLPLADQSVRPSVLSEARRRGCWPACHRRGGCCDELLRQETELRHELPRMRPADAVHAAARSVPIGVISRAVHSVVPGYSRCRSWHLESTDLPARERAAALSDKATNWVCAGAAGRDGRQRLSDGGRPHPAPHPAVQRRPRAAWAGLLAWVCLPQQGTPPPPPPPGKNLCAHCCCMIITDAPSRPFTCALNSTSCCS